MNTLGLILLIGITGGAGASSRLVVDRTIPVESKERFPWGTNIVNVTGSFALGYVTDLTMTSDDLRTVLAIGFLGGFTTFSTASVETVLLMTERRTLATIANALGMLIVCVAAAALGMALAA